MARKQVNKEVSVTIQYVYKVNHTSFYVARDLAELEQLVDSPIQSVEIHATIESNGRFILANSEPIKIIPPAIPLPEYPKKKTWPYIPDPEDNKPWVSPPGKLPPNIMYMTKNDHERTTHISPPVSSFEYWCRMDNKGD
jgi:hypothetical protein